MIHALALLLTLQLLGEIVAYALGLPIPGPVIGMTLLLALLAARRDWVARLKPVTTGLLSHLSLLFVPAGVGVIVHARRLADEGMAIVVAIVASTLLAIAATAWTVHKLWPREAPGGGI